MGQQTSFEEIEGARGEVFFKDGTKILSVNDDKLLIYAVPPEIEDAEATSRAMSGVISEDEAKILSKITKSDSSYVIIKNKLTKEEVKGVEDLKLKGIYIDRLPGRYYPQGKISSQVIGFVGGDGTGQYGIEGYFDDVLRGKTSFKEEPRTLILFDPDKLEYSSLDGSNIYLTIDYNIQFEAESLLKKAKQDFDIDSGQIIVLEPNTGEVVAMANYPGFDPNAYSKEKDIGIFQNSTVQKIFECGSVMKPLTMAMALNEKKITPDTTYTDEGFVKVGVETIYNYEKTKKNGIQTMTQVLEKSLNTGAVFVSRLIGPEMFNEYLDQFGIGEKTGIELQGEVSSRNENVRKGREINIATASFGQGIEMTPIQLVKAFAAIANGGKLMKPFIVKKIVDSQGDELETKPKVIRDVLSQETTTQLTAMLISSVKNGLAKNAGIQGYYSAGKTGTAQVPYEDRAGYYPDKTIHSFIGFAPALNPKFVMLIKLDNPKKGSSSSTVAPIFSKLAQHILNYWKIPPDYEQ